MSLIDTAQIAQLANVSRAHVTDRLTKRPGFPEPAINVSQRTRRWDEAAVLEWLKTGARRSLPPSSGSTPTEAASDPGGR